MGHPNLGVELGSCNDSVKSMVLWIVILGNFKAIDLIEEIFSNIDFVFNRGAQLKFGTLLVDFKLQNKF